MHPTAPQRKQLVAFFDSMMALIARLDDEDRQENNLERLKASVAELDRDIAGRKQQVAALDKEIAARQAQAAAQAAEIIAAAHAKHAEAGSHEEAARIVLKNAGDTANAMLANAHAAADALAREADGHLLSARKEEERIVSDAQREAVQHVEKASAAKTDLQAVHAELADHRANLDAIKSEINRVKARFQA